MYRTIVSVFEAGDHSLMPSEAATRALLEDGAGAIMIAPEGDPGRVRKNVSVNGSSGRPPGFADNYPASASRWLERAFPGEALADSFFHEIRSSPPARPEPRQGLGYLTEEWFDEMRRTLDVAKSADAYSVYYDELGYPSGHGDHTVPQEYHRRVLRRETQSLSGLQPFSIDLSTVPDVIAIVACNRSSGERVDLMGAAQDGEIKWIATPGSWSIQTFSVVRTATTNERVDYFATTDYFDPAAAKWFLGRAYEPIAEKLSGYIGQPLSMTFFDDVGIYSDEKSWHVAIGRRFESITGRPAATYYPALWDDIGTETAAARIGFFAARSQLLGEGFPKVVSEWAASHGLEATGHSPGNYDLQPTDMQGDPFEFYANVPIPMVDVIFGLGFGRGGFKVVSSVSNARDLPITVAETFSAYNSERGYRRVIEQFVRGMNRFVTGGRRALHPHGTPKQFNEWVGRTSMMLQGGRHVADVAILYPIASLQAFYSFDAPGNSLGLPAGSYIYEHADYQAVGEMLLSSLHRDFTFVHPKALTSEHLKVVGDTLQMQNQTNREEFRALVIPGGEVISADALQRIKAFFDAGGVVLATSLLPCRSAEFGRDDEVRELVDAIFGEQGTPVAKRRAAFIAEPTPEAIGAALEEFGIAADIRFERAPGPTPDNGRFGYIHKQRDGDDIYFFGNSSGEEVSTSVSLRGNLADLELWNPHTGEITPIADVGLGTSETTFQLKIGPVSSAIVVGRRQ